MHLLPGAPGRLQLGTSRSRNSLREQFVTRRVGCQTQCQTAPLFFAKTGTTRGKSPKVTMSDRCQTGLRKRPKTTARNRINFSLKLSEVEENFCRIENLEKSLSRTHNPKVVGSNPTPATNKNLRKTRVLEELPKGSFVLFFLEFAHISHTENIKKRGRARRS